MVGSGGTGESVGSIVGFGERRFAYSPEDPEKMFTCSVLIDGPAGNQQSTLGPGPGLAHAPDGDIARPS